jgi:DNA replication protein DnaC
MRRQRRDRTETRREISDYCKRVAFSQKAVELCETKANALQEHFLHYVLKSELENREAVRRKRLLREASFPVYKTLEGYELTSQKLPSNLRQEDLKEGDFIKDMKNIIMYGPVGTGKTHLAIALGIYACEKGIPVRFFTASELVVRLSEAFKSGNLEKFLKNILKAELLIIDEWGYVPIDKQGAQLLFRIISDSYERRSLIITTNLEFSKWGALFTDDQMAAAMIDRLIHHGHLIVFDGESYRMNHALMRQKN